MTGALVAGCVWLVVANVVAILPSRDRHWRAAYLLIALGVPILVWIIAGHGVWVALIFALAGGWILRWPVLYALRWMGRLWRR